ncbi:MAG: PilC/PilY family type IV pilus protein [Pseudomonadota bacterium]
MTKSKSRLIKSLLTGTLLGTATGAVLAADLSLPSVPLFLSGSAEPNLLIAIDNSLSMLNIVPDAPFSTSTTYPCTAAAAKVLSNTFFYDIGVSQNSRKVYIMRDGYYNPNANTTEFKVFDSTGANGFCFNPALDYRARLNGDGLGTFTFNSGNASIGEPSTMTVRFPDGYGIATYSGNFLNWYFNIASVSGVTWNGGQGIKPISSTASVQTRIEVSKSASRGLLATMDQRMRVGLGTYAGDNAGRLISQIGPLAVLGVENGKRAALDSSIANLTLLGNTPLAETLETFGQYFALGNTTGTTLAMHPTRTGSARMSCVNGSQSCDQPVTSIFPTAIENRTGAGETAGPTLTPPITLSCQKSFIAYLTDGRNTQDRNISAPLRDYDEDCTRGKATDVGSTVCPSTIDPHFERKTNRSYEVVNPGNTTDIPGFTNGSSDYLDDVAMALFDMDLRPNGFTGETNPKNDFKNNVRTYMIGFADAGVQNDILVQNSGAQGGGSFIFANNAASLTSAFNNVLNAIAAASGSASSASSNSGRLDTGSRIYQASFESNNWSGRLKSRRVSTGAGGACPSIPNGGLCPTVEWDAGTLLNSRPSLATAPTNPRIILSYKPSTKAGISFEWGNLDTAQQTLLNLNPSVLAIPDNQGSARVDYLRGSRSNEGIASNKFRPRDSLTTLGDVINSDPFFVGPPSNAYTFTGYDAFRAAQASRPGVIYVGANDGMLHGFRVAASTTPAQAAGDEVLAYVPSAAFGSATKPTLTNLTQNPYQHQFVVDGSPTVGDAQIGAANDVWASVLVGTMRSGGRGVFALNVTNPANFTLANADYDVSSRPNGVVMWEFNAANDATLGLTYSQPSIVKMRNGKWAAIIGNGYNHTATNGKAALYIIYLTGPDATTGAWTEGTHYRKLTVTPAATATDFAAGTVPNSLATPLPIDLDGDSVVDHIYAGDLKGRMWRFDVDNADPAAWSVAYGNTPMFTAVDGSGNAQPITTRPDAGLNLLTSDADDLMVYFGTGKYLEGSDNTQSGQNNQTFYGIFDAITDDASTATPKAKYSTPRASGRSVLRKQTVLTESTSTGFRTTSSNALNLATDKGWFIDLFNTNNNAAATGGAGNNKGERSVSRATLRFGRIIFTTLIPPASPCDTGGTGWLMTLDAKTGQPLATPPFDTNNDGVIDANDQALSGLLSNVGIESAPAVVSVSDNQDMYFLSGSGQTNPDGTPCVTDSCALTSVRGSAAGRQGRITWREVIK